MNIPERGLGRGLGSLLSSISDNSGQNTAKLALSQIVQGKHQPRKIFDDTSLKELAQSVKKQGIIQPLLVRLLQGSPQQYEIIAGERRWRAARMAGLTEVPVIITEYTDQEAMTVALVENLQRENLNPLEEAEALQKLKASYTLSQEELASQLGKSRSSVANALRLLQLPASMQKSLASGNITAGHARALLSVTDMSLREQLHEAILQHHLSVREAEAAAEVCKRKNNLPQELLPPAKNTSAQRAAKPHILKELQNLLRQCSGTKATISGSATQGKIHIPYSSSEELARVLELLGLQEQESKKHN